MYDFHMKSNDFATWKRIFVRQFYVFATLMSGKHCKTTISRPKCATVLRFCNTGVQKQSKTAISQNFCSTVLRFGNIKTIFVRQFYVFATLMSRKHCETTISLNFRSTVLRFCNIKTIFVRQLYVIATLMPENTVKQRI